MTLKKKHNTLKYWEPLLTTYSKMITYHNSQYYIFNKESINLIGGEGSDVWNAGDVPREVVSPSAQPSIHDCR